MTCCKSTSTGVGAPTTAPSNNDPDIYIEQPSGQIWVWNGTSWVKPPVGSVSYNSTTRVLTVGSSSVTLPIASKTEYGVVKLADTATDPNNPIEANTDGTLTINCVKLIQHCGLATKAYVDSKVANAIDAIPEPEQLTGAQIIAMLAAMSNTQLNSLACALVDNSSPTTNGLGCTGNGLSTKDATTTQTGSVRLATPAEVTSNTGTGVLTASTLPKAVAYSLLNGIVVEAADASTRGYAISAPYFGAGFTSNNPTIHTLTITEAGIADIYSQVLIGSPAGTYVEHHQDIYITRAGVRKEIASSYGAYKIYSVDFFTVPATLVELEVGDFLELQLVSFSDTSHTASLSDTALKVKYYS